MEENKQQELSKNRKEYISDSKERSDFFSDETEQSLSLEDSIEQFEPVLEKINELTNEIEENSDEIVIKAKDSSVLDKNRQILSELYNKGEFFLKKISERLATYPKGVAESFRDNHLKNKASKLQERFWSNKSLMEYRNFSYHSGGNIFEHKTIKEKAIKSFDSIYASSLPLQKIIIGDNWANSNNKRYTKIAINELLQTIEKIGLSIEKYDEVFNVLNIYENSRVLASNESDKDYFSELILNFTNHFHRNKTILEDNKRISEICRDNPYLILNYLNAGYNNYDLNKESDFIEQQLDKIINGSRENNYCNLAVNQYFEKSLLFNPEKFGLDPRNRQVIFESFKGSFILNKNTDYLKKNAYFFNKELGSMSEEDINEIIGSGSSYDFKKNSTQVLLSSMNLSDQNFKKMFDIFEKDSENWDQKREYSKDLLLQHFKSSNGVYVPFFKYRDFNLTPEDRISFFREIVDDCPTHSDITFTFFNQVLSNFENIFADIPEEQYEAILQNLINKSVTSLQGIRIIHSLLPEYNIPPKYKESINQIFSKKYSEGDSKSLNKIFGTGQVGQELTKHEEWLMKNNEISSRLEIEFYSMGNLNDFRHFFFDVLEGKKESIDKDLLIRKYAERINEFNAEEYIDLFITNKKIPIEYSGLFLKKVQNGGTLISQLETCVRLNQISKGEYKNILVDLVNQGGYEFAEQSLNVCLGENLLEATEKGKLLEDFAKNVVTQALSNWNINSYTLQNLMRNRYNSTNITEDDKISFYNKLFNELLNNEKLNDKILEINNNDTRFFQKGFSNEKDKEDFVNKLLLSNNNNAISKLLAEYLRIKNDNRKIEESNDPILVGINDKKFNTLFEHGLSLEGLSVDKVLMSYLSSVPKDKREILFQKLISKNDILEKSNNKEEIRSFCVSVASWIGNDGEKEEERIISKDIAKNLSTKIFSSQYLNDETFSELINYHRGFLSSDSDILDQCVSSLERRGSQYNCFFLLQTFESQDAPVLTEDQVKKLSMRFLQNGNINESIYKMHIDSTEDNLKFYLDQEIFNKNINKMCDRYTDLSIGTTIGFLTLQKKEKNRDNENHNHIVLSDEQEEALIRKLLISHTTSNSNFEELYDLDKHLFDKLLDDILMKKELPIQSIGQLILTKGEISDTYFDKIIDYYITLNSNFNYIFDNICDRYFKDPVLLKKTKDKINNLSNIENRSVYKSKLLQRDLLSQEELKNFYEEIHTESNVYSQVLLSAEILGSLVYSDRPEKDNLFKFENKETQKNIDFISSFVKKYSQESKGRSIAVMLFSREYLPERNIDEVIEKVADTLSKYEKVLDQYKYEGIPKGLHASIGMEYEITHSTAEAYKEIKNRDLKTDIVRLSQAAHIGNGRDAVHEIATRPATNPYLLLLEMQLLNDIEYIDLNFDRTELYQKGARGFHVTIGGEEGLYVNANTNFLQNSILAASWGGIHAGEIGKRVSGGRGVTLRGRDASGGNNNVKVFENPTNSVELRSLSVDKMESFQRAIVTTFNGAIAIQALEKCTSRSSDQIYKFYKNDSSIRSEKEFIEELKNQNYLKEGYDSDEKNMKIVYAWAEMVSTIKDALEYHNNEFLEGETMGYLDKDGVWVDAKDFGGNYNDSRFNSVVSSTDPTLSVEEYVNSTKININKFFSSFDIEFADSLTKINNLYLKPGSRRTISKDGKELTMGGGDQANSISMLEITKLNNENLEYRNDDSYLKGTVFDTLGERREGYYCVQGGSEKMITHACQIALLNFNKKMEEIVNK